MDIGDRIKQIRGGLSREEFALKIGTDKSTVQRYENENNIPKGDILLRIHKIFGTNITWLLTGEGEQFQKSSYPKETLSLPVKESSAQHEYENDPFSRAASALKEIFDSGDPVLIDAIRANLYVFQLYARKARQLEQHLDQAQRQSVEITELREELESLKKLIADLECKKNGAENL